jgi:hypothetical protein
VPLPVHEAALPVLLMLVKHEHPEFETPSSPEDANIVMPASPSTIAWLLKASVK